MTPEERQKYNKEYREKYPMYDLVYQRKWRENNRERANQIYREYRARKKLRQLELQASK